MKKNISAVVINYNGKEYLDKCLNELMKHDELSEIIVVDDASTDGNPEMVREEYPSVKLIINPKNNGPVFSRQVGYKKAKGDYIVFIDCDILVQKDTISKLRDFLEKNDDFWLAGSKLSYENEVEVPWSYGYAPNVFKNLLYSVFRIGLFSEKENYEVGWVRESCFMVRKGILDEIGGFDTDIFMFHEGPDISLRAGKKGYKTAFVLESKALDLDQKSRTSEERFEFFWRYNRYFYKKHYSFLSYLGITAFIYAYFLFRMVGFKNKTHYE